MYQGIRRKTTKFKCEHCGREEYGNGKSKYCIDCKYVVMNERANARLRARRKRAII